MMRHAFLYVALSFHINLLLPGFCAGDEATCMSPYLSCVLYCNVPGCVTYKRDLLCGFGRLELGLDERDEEVN